jgi:hypothetical protein
VSERATSARRRAPWPLLVGAAVLLGLGLIGLVSLIGVTGVVLIAGVVGSFAVVVLAAVRRRPIDVRR